NGQFLIPQAANVVAVDPQALARKALASIGIAPPVIRTSPSWGRQLYVQLPTWLWLDHSWWRSYTATAKSGQTWSGASATPVSVTWQTGDGGRVTCNGPGTAWRPGVAESASGCIHTYRASSAGSRAGRFTLEATVQFEITWTSNASGGGTLPGISRT